jgi:hypothetical protein
VPSVDNGLDASAPLKTRRVSRPARTQICAAVSKGGTCSRLRGSAGSHGKRQPCAGRSCAARFLEEAPWSRVARGARVPFVLNKITFRLISLPVLSRAPAGGSQPCSENAESTAGADQGRAAGAEKRCWEIRSRRPLPAPRSAGSGPATHDHPPGTSPRSFLGCSRAVF